ncbi:xanthine dehydrogenase small subunit [Salinihabitans flavidus]|uniref:Xanthine dehydrogenase small subunit n=1 Tax=Salinihabitans flavidus TaxID=569882 RepID=A0A1H8W4R6_9RHOB|nr:FAD binding domain-containing protein [Salinihabitans flavidus]SEP22619.1 xanthine dehydrogenase small subunit [Salinihabitans flavidus]
MAKITLNGQTFESGSDPRKPFLEVLREEFGLRGTKYGCGEGECGACTVVVDGETVCACLTLTGSLAGKEVTTVEGLANDPVGVALFNSFARHGAVQCGFCTPGFVMSAWQLLAKQENPDTDAIRDAVGGNLCRCTGYVRIVDAIRECGLGAANSPVVARIGEGGASDYVAQAYWRPASLEELFHDLGSFSDNSRMIAGGTDLMVQNEHRLNELELIDISGLSELRGISQSDGSITIGALTSWAEIGRSKLIERWAPLLGLASHEVGGIQIQNRGTIGGNIANASPAADGLPGLYVYDAMVELASSSGQRSLPIADFMVGPGRTSLAAGEVITAVRIPKVEMPGTPLVFFEKVGPRKAQTITKASLAFHGWMEEGRIVAPRIALGAVAPTVLRAREAERMLAKDITVAGVAMAAAQLSGIISPIDDIRSTAEYRSKLITGLLRRGFASHAGIH